MTQARKQYVNVTELKGRGWTDASIRDFLGDADELQSNRYGGLTRLYDKDRVDEVEASVEFHTWKERSIKRRSATEAALATKTANTCSRIREAVEYLDIPVIPTRQLVELAIRSWRSLPHRPGRDRSASVYSDPDFLARIAENYIRHEITHQYDLACVDLIGRVGKDTAYHQLRASVDKAINTKYPNLHGTILEMQNELEDPASSIFPTASQHGIPNDERHNYYESFELKNRGWTRGLRRLLGTADGVIVSRYDPPTRVWLRSRVLAIEATPEWQNRRGRINCPEQVF